MWRWPEKQRRRGLEKDAPERKALEAEAPSGNFRADFRVEAGMGGGTEEWEPWK